MADYKYSLVRYFPDPIKDEPANVGIILHSAGEEYLGFRFDLRRAASKLSRPDRQTFKHFQEQLLPIENEDVAWPDSYFENYALADTGFLDRLADYMGTKIRFTAPRGCISDDPDMTLDNLFARLVSAGMRIAPRVTKRTLVRQIKHTFQQHNVGRFVKSKPLVRGAHRNYALPLGIRHSHRTFIEVLKLDGKPEKNYRAMAAVGRLWQDARRVQANRLADLFAVIHYTNGRLPEGERLLEEDGVQIVRRPTQVLAGIDLERIRSWE